MANRSFLDYYNEELSYLRDAGALFAKSHPNVAGRLKLDGSETADPHVERLIESFAFLTARLQHNIDNIANETTNALIDILYPHLNKPIPAMSIAQFRLGSGGNAPSKDGFEVKRHTELFTYASNDSVCKFRTVYKITLFPMTLENIAIVPNGAYTFIPIPNTVEFGYDKHSEITTYFLELTLRSKDGVLQNFNLEELCFYLNINDQSFKKQIYEAIFSNQSLTYCVREGESVAIPMLPSSLVPMGIDRDETAIPTPTYDIHSYQLLQEFIHFSDKFMFFKLKNLNFLHHLRNGNFLQMNSVKILIPLGNATSEWTRKIKKNDILMNCTPVVNLSKMITDPVSWDKKQVFYNLSPNSQQNRTIEIYQIENVYSIDPETGKEKRLQPYYSFERFNDDEIYWWSKREQISNKNITGFNTLITFIETKQPAEIIQNRIFYAQTLCTNQFLSEDIQQSTKMLCDSMIPASDIILLQRPVTVGHNPSQKNTRSDLISLLATNHSVANPSPSNINGWIKCMLEDRHAGLQRRKYTATIANGVMPQKNAATKDNGHYTQHSNTESCHHPIYTDDQNIVIQILNAIQNISDTRNKQASDT
ncbi:MAG: type VI secretion system baseplate subunit TssF [Holosporales bacterium]|jgi:type VI secretion system protein ImpG|nr:type VI secretion system baseplate subunit TssF [Holosporales bacterium]